MKLGIFFLTRLKQEKEQKEEKGRAKKWRDFEHKTSKDQTETRYIREILYGKRRCKQYWEITKDKDKRPKESTGLVMTKITPIKSEDVGNIYKIRAGVEYGFKQSRGMRPAACELECIQARSAGKSELGWADFRVTDYTEIENWWQLVLSAYLMRALDHET